MTVTTRPTLADSGLLREDLFIGGQWSSASDGSRVPVVDPASGETIANVAYATREDTRRAIAAAGEAFPAWAALTAVQRGEILRQWFELIVENKDELAGILTSEMGKPLGEAVGEILYGAKFIEWFAEEGKRAYGEVIPTNVSGRRLFALRQPIGVAAAITPWNFPMAMIARKVGPALAAGCPMVIKPATETPLSALALAVLGQQAGIPEGVLNVVPGSGRIVGDELATSPDVRALSFTGSTEVGKELMAKCAGNVKKVAMELGGNAPVIVFDDADLEVAVAGAITSKFKNAGQTCVCANRVYVQAGIHDAFLARFNEEVAALRVGDGFVDGVDQGPLINDAAVEKVEEHIADAVRGGAVVAVGGERHALGGTYFEPTVLTGMRKDMMIAREETFGPVAAVFTFESEEEAVQLANDTPYGLAAYFFTRDMGRTWRVAEALEYGVVAVNTGSFSYEGAPFGGFKESGVGREGSRHGIDEFTEIKYVAIDGING